jgi:citrate synthase
MTETPTTPAADPTAVQTANPAGSANPGVPGTETPTMPAGSTETPAPAPPPDPEDGGGAETLTVRDNRTGKEYDMPIVEGTVRASDLGAIRVSESAPPLAVYDPGFVNTASCRSAVTFIDGDRGILEYRGYPIEQLAEKSSFLEVAYLLVHGELPTRDQYDGWVHDITYHTFVHENVRTFMQGFRYDAHPMGMLLASVGALSTFYPESRNISDAENRHMQVVRLIAKMPTLGAWSFRHAQGKPYVYPDNDLGYAANFLAMLFKMSEQKFNADERLIHALEVLFILHADHEQNCSTNAVRAVGSSQVDPYSAVAAGIAALYGPLHGGANEAVLRMLRNIGSVDKVPDFIDCVKTGKERLMGFGHRVYKNFDPRATIIKKATEDVFAVTGVNPLLKIAVELEKIALEDEYFVKRKLYPNVDFYSGLIYEALQFPPEMFTVLFAIPRTSGWLAQWLEMVQDPDQKIARPKQIYTGGRGLEFVAASDRWK